MGEELRPDPDKLLSRMRKAAAGKTILKIFFGMSAGVGKTYTMLKEARSLLEREEDVVIGWLESHGRKETDALAGGMEFIPWKKVSYRDLEFNELDMDAILARKPAVVLVDELAHSNTPGLKHPKRYQDVLDLIDAGISVYTTVNIQHLESLADIIEEIAGVKIRERVPDSLFDRADEIQLVDIPPGELLERLDEGKVYLGDKSREAAAHFFTKENLALLRELALKQAAQLASHQLRSLLHNETSAYPVSADETILVAAGSSPTSEYIIRWARRYTYTLKARWICIHVETGLHFSEFDKENLTRNLTLARNLGAEVISVPGEDMVKVIVEYAQQNNIAAIIIGKSGMGKKPPLFRKPSNLSERLIRESGKITVITVQEKVEQQKLKGKYVDGTGRTPPWQWGAALAAVGAVTGLNLLITPYAGYLSASILYLAAILLLSLVLKRLPILLTACISALIYDYLFIPPWYTFTINKTEDVLMLLLYFLLAITTGWMTNRLKTNERMLIIREKRMALLTELSSSLESADSAEKAALIGIEFITRAFKADTMVFLRKEDESGLAEVPLITKQCKPDAKELSAAHYCFTSGQATGRFTSTLPLVAYHFIPMAAPGGTIGVVGINLESYRSWIDAEESFLMTMSNTTSLALQREILYERNRKNLLLQESERLSRLLLHSISHELRTPLTGIQGNASALLDRDTAGDIIAREQLIMGILSNTTRLNRIVENLLSMNRLESGRLHLIITQVDPEELISLALKQVEDELINRKVIVNTPDSLPLIACDILLMIQVVVNLLQNIINYTNDDTAAEIGIEAKENFLWFYVQDYGPGVKENDLPHLFEKFYRGENAGSKGTGLGLSICKGIVEAHGGTICAKNIAAGGFRIEFALPLKATEGLRL